MNFGDYCLIEQKRYGCENEMFVHKIIGRMCSNYYVDIPALTPLKETIHKEIVEVLSCVRCGVVENEVKKYKYSDCKKVNR